MKGFFIQYNGTALYLFLIAIILWLLLHGIVRTIIYILFSFFPVIDGFEYIKSNITQCKYLHIIWSLSLSVIVNFQDLKIVRFII
jgi:hypothetical protein